MSITEREWRRAQEQGATLRRAGRPITALPDFGSGRNAQLLREAAEDAWKAEDAARRKVAA